MRVSKWMNDIVTSGVLSQGVTEKSKRAIDDICMNEQMSE